MAGDVDLVTDDLMGAEQQVFNGDVLLDGVGNAIERAFTESRQIEDCLPEGLARDGSGVDAYTTKDSLALDQSDSLIEFRGLDGCPLACRSRPDHDQVVVIGWHASL